MVDEYGPALEFDLWTRARVAVSDLGEAVSWGLAWALVRGFVNEWGTHTHAAVAGWSFPASLGDVSAALHLHAFRVVNTEEKSRGDVVTVFPWTVPGSGVVEVSDEERRAAVARLDAVSAIPD